MIIQILTIMSITYNKYVWDDSQIKVLKKYVVKIFYNK